jgi:mono/diheme cytochrome c family protein
MTKRLILVALALGLLMQFIPYGHDQTNPAVTGEPNWDRPRTRELFSRVCKDCHTNETSWPWYGQIAPVSWLTRWDVDEGRSHFNASEWGRPHNEGDEAAKMVREGEMPLWYYLPAHPEARLSEVESEELLAGLMATFGDEEHDEEHAEEHH